MYPWIPWELVVVPFGSGEHTLGSTAFTGEGCLKISHLTSKVVENRRKRPCAVNGKCTRAVPKVMNNFFFACELGTADEGECGGRWNQLLCHS